MSVSMRVVPHRLDPAKWIQHFKEQSMGIRHPTKDGYIFVSDQVGEGAGNSRPTPIEVVSPVQQIVDQAKSKFKREGKRKSPSLQHHSKKKKKKYSDFFN